MADGKFSINDFITMDGNGVTKADYADIVKTLLGHYRAIYGIDVDLDPRTADGRFIYDVATIIDSGLEVIKQLYTQLDPNSATGAFLDILCSLTNVHRLSATPSIASVEFVNLSDFENSITLSGDDLILIDDSGNEWRVADDSGVTSVTVPYATSTIVYVYDGVEYVTKELAEKAKGNGDGVITTTGKIIGGRSGLVPFQCSVDGAISTSAFTFLIYNGKKVNIEIEMIDLGSEEESDIDLKNRRAESSSYGYTLTEGLRGALLNVYGVKDALIYANNGDTDTNGNTTKEEYLNNIQFTMGAHSIAVLVRPFETYEPISFKENVATTIDNYLTPSVSTKQDNFLQDSNFTEYSFIDKGTNISYSVWFGICSPVTPTITIRIRPTNNYVKSTDNIIANALVSHLNGLAIDYYVQSYELCTSVQNADPKSNGSNTYYVSDVSIKGNISSSARPNKGCYYYYGTSENYNVKGIDNGNGTRNITITEKDDTSTTNVAVTANRNLKSVSYANPRNKKGYVESVDSQTEKEIDGDGE